MAPVERVEVVPYDAMWPARFERERLLLREVFDGLTARIEHVGSTAVPGLVSKPVIDIAVGLPSLVDAEARIEGLRDLGYEYVPQYEIAIPDRRYFRKPVTRPRTHHVHCVVLGSEGWIRTLLFRDRLREDREIAKAYGTLKVQLSQTHDRGGYSEAKGPFIESVLASGPL